MKGYEKYKATGIEWLPLIPSHWCVTKISALFEERKQKVSDTIYAPLSVSKSGIIPQLETAVKTDNGDNRKLVKIGDFVVNSRSDRKGSCGISHLEGSVSVINTVLKPRKELNKMFFHYLLRSNGYVEEYYKLGRGIVADLWTTRYSELKNINIPFPPLVEQEKIVNYLEDRTSKIDEAISAKGKQIKLLQELKDAEIANVITRGLDPNVKMKDSGIPWIGQIPKHWEVVRLKAILTESKEKTSVDGGTLLSLSQYTGVTLKDSANKTGMFEAESTIGYNIVHPGQFVMNIMLAWNGSYAVSDYEGVISPAYCVFNFNVDCEKKYFHYLLRLPAYSGAFKTQSKGIIDSRLRLYPQYFLAFMTIVPPIEEQRIIVEYIENKCNKVDSLMKNLETEIAYLKEYKQKLIADCVTGQINVQSEQ